jgi:hypothetical protein
MEQFAILIVGFALGVAMGWLIGEIRANRCYMQELDALVAESDSIRAEWNEFHEDFHKEWRRGGDGRQ